MAIVIGEKIRLIIAGGRDFNNQDLLFEKVTNLLQNYNHKDIEIVSGGAKGADRLGELYADYYSLKLKVFNANWEEYGRSGGYIRNVEMAKYGTACVVFWDNQSKGSKHMIDIAKKEGLPLRVIKY